MKRLLLPLVLFILSCSSAFSQVRLEWLQDTIYQDIAKPAARFIVRGLRADQTPNFIARFSGPASYQCQASGYVSIFSIGNMNAGRHVNGDTLTVGWWRDSGPERTWLPGRKDMSLEIHDTMGANYSIDTVLYLPQVVYFKRNSPLPAPTTRFTPSVVHVGDAVQIEVIGNTPVESVMGYFGIQDTATRGKSLDSFQGGRNNYDVTSQFVQILPTGQRSGVYEFPGDVYRPLVPGVYDVLLSTGSLQCDYFPAGLTVLPRDTSIPEPAQIEGDVYIDKSGNCALDGMDIRTGGAVVKGINAATGRNYAALTDVRGHYVLRVPPGTYRVALQLRGDMEAHPCRGSQTVVVPSAASTVAAAPILDSVRAGDMGIDVSLLNMGPARVRWVSIQSRFSGDFDFTGRTLVELDSLLSYVPSSSDSVVVDSVVGQRVYLKAHTGSTRTTGIYFDAFRVTLPADGSLIGRTVTCKARRLGGPDANPANDTASATALVVGSFDPNDKQVSPESRRPGVEGDLTYTIRFQNTGTDTAFYVSVRDTLSPLLDLSTLHGFVSTHKAEYKLTGRVLEARFPFINLLDSNSNEPASHGQFSFKVKPVAGLALGQQIENRADIYFDYNDPVRTNTAVFRVQQPTALVAAKQEVLQWVPNPATDVVRLPVSSAPQGRLLAMNAAGRIQALPYQYRDGVVQADLRPLSAGVYQLRFEDGKAAGRVAVVR